MEDTQQPSIWRRLWWAWSGRCSVCGGTIVEYSWRLAYCEDCNTRY